ncbi:MAG TPA: TonB-dependent receptor, partial [Bryobacteraceae bacterium]|nr:TonB-dependent receptor [Bryobacteraceae bacterium]
MHSRNGLRIYTCALATLLLAAALLTAQETRGTILGSVKDPSAAVIPGATVVITNTDTNTVVRTTSNQAGLFEAPLLMPGQYEVAVESTGFKSYVRRGLTLTVGSRIALDVRLEIGQTADAITVTAEEPLVETTSASVGQTFDNRSVQELPVLGNSVMLMAGLAEGMQRTGGYNYLGLHSTVGASDYKTAGGVGGNEWTLDGTPNTGHTRRAAYLPYTDAVAEFRVEASSFDASVGHTTGAIVQMQSKAGTNNFHGQVTENHWQQRWNATPTNDNGAYWSKIIQAEAAGDKALAARLRSEPKQPSGRSNNYAASLGGPVILPKIFNGRDKLFFFFIFNGFKDSKTEEPGNKLFSVPTEAERRGDYSRLLAINPARYQIYDPLTTRLNPTTGLYEREPFPGNIIPQNRFLNPIYKFYEKLMPLPNNPPQMDAEGRNNYFNGNIPYDWDYKAFQNRVDYIAREADRFFVRWSYNKFLEDRNDWTYATARFLHSNGLTRINKNAGVDWIHTFSPTTMLNVAMAYNRYVDNGYNTAQLKYKPSDVGLPAYVDAKAGDNHILPRVDFSDNSYHDVSGGYPKLQPISVGTVKADLIKQHGRHSLKMGWDGRMYYRTTGSPGNSSGYFEFRNNLTRRTSNATGVGLLGHEWAAFQLGIPNSMSIDTNDNSYITTPYQALFVQDNFRLTTRLTLNLGARLEYEGSIRERFNRGLRDFDPNAEVAIADAVQRAYAASPQPERPASDFVIRGGVNYLGLNAPRERTNPTWRVMPRVGLAFAYNPKTVFRGGYGIYYDTLNVTHTTIDQSGFSRGTGTT